MHRILLCLLLFLSVPLFAAEVPDPPLIPAFGALCPAFTFCTDVDKLAWNTKVELHLLPASEHRGAAEGMYFATSVSLVHHLEVGASSAFMQWAALQPHGPDSGGLKWSYLRLSAKGILWPLFKDPEGHFTLAAGWDQEMAYGPFTGYGLLGQNHTLSAARLGVTYPVSIFRLAAGAGAIFDPADPGRALVMEGSARFLLKLPDIDSTSYSFFVEGLGRGALRGDRSGLAGAAGFATRLVQGVELGFVGQIGRGAALPPWSVGIRFSVSYGAGYTHFNFATPPDGYRPGQDGELARRIGQWLAAQHATMRRFQLQAQGWIDPVVGADGCIYSDDGLSRLMCWGRPDPDPWHPGQILPHKQGQPSLQVGQYVLVHPEYAAVTTPSGKWIGYGLRVDEREAIDRALAESRKAHEDEEARTRARSCPYCLPDPMPDYNPAPGYAAGCIGVRWVVCGVKPWDLEGLATVPPPPFPRLRVPQSIGVRAAPPSVQKRPAPSVATHVPPAAAKRPAPPVAEHGPRGGADPRVSKWSSSGSRNHADQPGRLPDQVRGRYPETEFEITRPGQPGQDVKVVGGKHPSDYPGSTWPKGVDHADFKPDTPGGRKTFRRDQKTKWQQPTHMLPYDPVTGKLR